MALKKAKRLPFIQRATIFGLYSLGYSIMLGLSFLFMRYFFFDGSVSTKVEWGAGSLIGIVMVFAMVLLTLRHKKRDKEIAIAVTQESGNTSMTNPKTMVVLNWLTMVLPIGGVSWMSWLVRFYESSIHEVLLWLLIPITLGWMVIWYTEGLKEHYLVEFKNEQENTFAAKVASFR